MATTTNNSNGHEPEDRSETVRINSDVIFDLVVPFRMVETLIPNAETEYMTEALRSANARYQLLVAYENAITYEPHEDIKKDMAKLVARKDPVLTERMDAFDWGWDDIAAMLDDEDWFFGWRDLEPTFATAIEYK